ncbi:MAG: transposase [Akkermansia sp.]|nr:transposase [Akkermansia sp.]
MKNRASYTPEEKLQIVRAVLSKKTTIQKVAKEKQIAPTLISLWKKQAEDAMMARFQPQPKGRRKITPAVAPADADTRSLKNEARKAKIKAAHLEASVKEMKARCAKLEDLLSGLTATLGYKMVKARTSRKGRKA